MGMIWVGYRRSDSAARQLLEDEKKVSELLASAGDAMSVDLDKAWQGLHWLLTTSSGPTDDQVSDAVFGGEEVGGDLGYGPGRLLSAQGVKAVDARLRDVQPETLRARMDPAAMEIADIYPPIWDEEDVFDTYLAPAFEDLCAFYSAAAAAGESVIQTVT